MLSLPRPPSCHAPLTVGPPRTRPPRPHVPGPTPGTSPFHARHLPLPRPAPSLPRPEALVVTRACEDRSGTSRVRMWYLACAGEGECAMATKPPKSDPVQDAPEVAE